MKRCPNCATDYFDEMLEFCLEDGAKLYTVAKTVKDAPPVTKPNAAHPFTEKTLNLPYNAEIETVQSIKSNDVPKTIQSAAVVEKKISPVSKVLEISPIIIALAHNWWQWLYAANQTSTSVSTFLISANFLVWLFLLAAGAGIGVLAIKRARHKGYALISLVILAVNLILFVVPKR